MIGTAANAPAINLFLRWSTNPLIERSSQSVIDALQAKRRKSLIDVSRISGLVSRSDHTLAFAEALSRLRM
jgi:hypothetical protein